MAKRNSHKKKAAMGDGKDDNITKSRPSPTMLTSLNLALDALDEKKGSTREKALSAIIDLFSGDFQYDFVEEKCLSLLHACLNSIKRKKGSSNKEICLASRVIGLLALTAGCGDNARKILEEAVTPISQALLESGSDSSKIVALLECLAIITFVGENYPAETEKSMQIIWQLVHPKLGSNNVVAVKPSAAVTIAMVSAWSFLLTTMERASLHPKDWQDCISYLSSLLEEDDPSVCIAAGEALALVFEEGSIHKFSTETCKGSSDNTFEEGNKKSPSLTRVQGLEGKILNQVRDLSSTKSTDLNDDRWNLFRAVLEFLEDGLSPETPFEIGEYTTVYASTWSELIQLHFLEHFLAGGFVMHMQENEFLHNVFGFNSRKKHLQVSEHHDIQGSEHHDMSGGKYSFTRIYHEPFSFTYKYFSRSREYEVSNNKKKSTKFSISELNKARKQCVNKQRVIAEERNVGYFAATLDEEQA